jgi:hypothetical protein
MKDNVYSHLVHSLVGCLFKYKAEFLVIGVFSLRFHKDVIEEIMVRRKCWVGVIFFQFVWGGASDLTSVYDDPSLVVVSVSCVSGTSLRGSQGGQDWPLLVM